MSEKSKKTEVFFSAYRQCLKAASLSQPKSVRYDLSIKFPVSVSPTGYFRDVFVVLFKVLGWTSITTLRAETYGKTLKLFMRIPHKFIDPNRGDGELANVIVTPLFLPSERRQTSFIANMAMMVTYGAPPELWLFHLRWKMSFSSSRSGAMAGKLFSPN